VGAQKPTKRRALASLSLESDKKTLFASNALRLFIRASKIKELISVTARRHTGLLEAGNP